MTAQENLFALECFPSKVRDDETHVCRRPKPDKLPQLAAGVGQDKLHPVAGDGFCKLADSLYPRAIRRTLYLVRLSCCG